MRVAREAVFKLQKNCRSEEDCADADEMRLWDRSQGKVEYIHDDDVGPECMGENTGLMPNTDGRGHSLGRAFSTAQLSFKNDNDEVFDIE